MTAEELAATVAEIRARREGGEKLSRVDDFRLKNAGKKGPEQRAR